MKEKLLWDHTIITIGLLPQLSHHVIITSVVMSNVKNTVLRLQFFSILYSSGQQVFCSENNFYKKNAVATKSYRYSTFGGGGDCIFCCPWRDWKTCCKQLQMSCRSTCRSLSAGWWPPLQSVCVLKGVGSQKQGIRQQLCSSTSACVPVTDKQTNKTHTWHHVPQRSCRMWQRPQATGPRRKGPDSWATMEWYGRREPRKRQGG